MEEEEVEYTDEIVVSRHPTAYREKATSASCFDTVSPVSQKKKRAKLSTTLRVFEATYFDETYVHEISSAALYEWELRARDMRASAEQQSECYTSIMRIMYADIMCAVLPKYLATFVASFIREKSVAEELSDLDGRRRDLAHNEHFSHKGCHGAVACERCGCRSWGADSISGPRPGTPYKAQSFVPKSAVEAYLADLSSHGNEEIARIEEELAKALAEDEMDRIGQLQRQLMELKSVEDWRAWKAREEQAEEKRRMAEEKAAERQKARKEAERKRDGDSRGGLGLAVSWLETPYGKSKPVRCGCDACWEDGCTHVSLAIDDDGACIQCGCLEEYDRNGERQCWCDSCFKFGCSTRVHNGLFSLVTYIDAGALDMDLGCLSCEGAMPSHYAQAPPCPQCHAPCGLDYERGCRGLSVWPSFTACTECGFCPSEDPRCSQCHAPCGLSYERGCGWIAAGGPCGVCEWCWDDILQATSEAPI